MIARYQAQIKYCATACATRKVYDHARYKQVEINRIDPIMYECDVGLMLSSHCRTRV